jgi:hypothetical protein
MMTAQPLTADQPVIAQHLQHITRRWHELNTPCVFEIRLLTSDDQAIVKDVSRYSATDQGIDQAAQHIAAMNAYKLNAYVVVNPIDASVQIETGKAAKDEHIIGSFFHWADGDDQQAADNIRSFVGPRSTFYVLTGTKPCYRPHAYWELEEPTRNMEAWNKTQKAIAATLKTDASVVNASRIMRVAGTVNWPKPKKLAKGYIPEVTTLNIYDEDERPLVTSERMARAFVGSASDSTSAIMRIDTGTHDQKSADHYADILRRARTDGEKHTGVRDLAASLAGAGVPRHMAEAIVKEACPVWDEGVVHLIDTAYAKFFKSDPAVTFDYAPAAEPGAAAGWQVQSAADFTADFVAPEYLIDGVVQRGRLYTLTAPTGSGKTAVMLYIGTAMSRGKPVCDRETEPGDVIYMAGENPDDVRGRVIATMDAQEINPRECRLHFIAGTFSIRQDMKLIKEAIDRLPNVTLVVVDTLAAYFDGDDSNSNAQMLDFARVLRTITTAGSKPAVIVPAHPIKNAAKNNLTPMGGSALLNEVDGNLCLWKRDAAVEMHWQGKHRGAEFAPLMFEMKSVQSELVKDSKGRVMPTVMAVPLLEVRAMEIAETVVHLEDRLLLSIEASETLSIRQRCVDIGYLRANGEAHKSGMMRMLEKLQREKLVDRLRSNWRLTRKGEEAVEIIKNGGSIVDPDL